MSRSRSCSRPRGPGLGPLPDDWIEKPKDPHLAYLKGELKDSSKCLELREGDLKAMETKSTNMVPPDHHQWMQ